MFLEQLIERTIAYLNETHECFFEKRYLPIQIYQHKQNGLIQGKLLKKSFSDYFGLIDSCFVAFEAKQTSSDFFELRQIKIHQFEYLKRINELNGHSFLILYFFIDETGFLISLDLILDLLDKQKIVSLDQLKILASKSIKVLELKLVFPGIFNLYELLKSYLSNTKRIKS